MRLLAFKEAADEILKDTEESIRTIPVDQIEKMVDVLLDSMKRKILIIGTGRSGLVGRSFAMRLMHLGYDVHVLGETITPAIGKKDIVVAISGSGATMLPVTSARIAKKVGAFIVAVTSKPNSPLGKIADQIVHIRAKSKAAKQKDFFLRQIVGEHESLAPLGTLFEIAATIFLDSLIVELMRRLGKTEGELKARHATLEGL
jgi:6-phospho-3-hexuloisomerase